MPSTTIRLLGVATATALLAGLTPAPGSGVTAPPPRRCPRSSRPPPGSTTSTCAALVQPSAAQKSAAAGLGGTVRWNQFGTPASISPVSGTLGAASSTDAVAAARSWLGSHAALFGLSATQLKGLTLVSNQKLAGSSARAVLLRQDFGGPSPALGSMVTVGVGNGAIQYVTSSLVRTSQKVPAAVALPHGRLDQGRRQRRPRRPHLRARRRSPRRSAGAGSRSPASPRSSRSACVPWRTPTAPCARSSRPTWSTSRAAPPRRTR